MIKLFRNIRKKLLQEGPSESSRASKTNNPAFAKASTGTYLKYAIGEIILVVVGILIALQINNWNENNKERRLENTYLIRLSEDLEKDLTYLNLEINKRMDKYEVAKKMTLNLAEIDYKLKRGIKEEDMPLIIYGWSQFYPNNNTYLELLSTGNLNLIKNDSVKNSLFELQKQWLALEREYKTINDFRISYIIDRTNELSDNVSYYAMALSKTDKNVIVSDEQINTFKKNVSKSNKILDKDSIYRNGIAIEILLNNALIIILENFKNHVEKTLHFVNSEKSTLSH